MRYHNVCLESFGYCLPEEVVTSEQIERRLAPLYRRLRLPEGRLELMSGIAERRFWPVDMPPSDKSVASGRRAIEAAGIDPQQIGALVHGSVCRDFVEPATACSVHHRLGLPADCMIYDVSNACLGLLSGAVQVANMIELGQIRAGLVVGTENGRSLVENTIGTLNDDTSMTRRRVKLAVASLTIGSASCAMLLVDRELSRTGNRLAAAACRADTAHHELCHSGRAEAADPRIAPLMQTDSEQLMRRGIATGVDTYHAFMHEAELGERRIDKTFCHQVGVAHRKLMLESLELDPDADFTTLRWLGNTGSAALPVTMAIGAELGHACRNDTVGMLGIGSGINSTMLAVEWQQALVSGDSAVARQYYAPQPKPAAVP